MFDKNIVVLERILQEASILTNLRKEIEVNGQKRAIYAFYQNGGYGDIELKYDRINNPQPTTQDSTLCEIYSLSRPDMEEDLRQKSVREKKRKEGEPLNKGPRILDFMDSLDYRIKDLFQRTSLAVSQVARDGKPYNFWHSAHNFQRHFNQICESLDYDLRLVDEEEVEILKNGAYAVKVQTPEQAIIVPIGINLDNEDPTLTQALDAIAAAYSKTHGSVPQQVMYL